MNEWEKLESFGFQDADGILMFTLMHIYVNKGTFFTFLPSIVGI